MTKHNREITIPKQLYHALGLEEMTDLTEGTRLPAQIRTSTPAEAVYESGSDEVAE